MNNNNDIISQLEKILHRGHSSYSIFQDWLDLMLYALQGDDEHYLEIVRKYKNDQPAGNREIDFFTKAFSLLMIKMKENNEEVLGEVYMQWNQNNKYHGQFFTPKHIASFMAQITKPHGRISDPTCGSGIMLVEAIKTMSNSELDEAIFYGQDIDLTCVKMTALNLLFFNVNGFVVWGNTLTLECNKVYQTSRSYLGGNIRELSETDLETFKQSYKPAIQKVIQEKPILENQKTEQLSFF